MTVRITAIIGDVFHEESAIRDSLEAALRLQGLLDEVHIRYAPYDQLEECLAERPAAVILFKEDRLNPGSAVVNRWMTAETAGRIAEYVRQGGGWLGWHSGLASFENVKEYIGMLRGHFLFHPREHSEVTYKAASNGLGIPSSAEFSLLDEHYFVECDEANTNVFLRSSSRDGESVAGWYHELEGGKVCCFTPAHTREGLLNQELLAVLGPVLRWIVT
ncbi:ThuA domain-containing protein [Paenibacillus doosanensis]|uniref:ThuA domain-containing protein n=1 Tax=Paenibacillus doosanensis TaxID=1229154 RepID=UPI0021802792|nr:ThuA domain-containing protein [Paenibacillus doosanensis]MCS7462907.1 ThuA domain-containing protein [Paenibacillus doosanensis]